MIILDTNVISELMRDEPAAKVFEWVDALPLAEVYTTAINQAEVLFGIAAMPVGRKRQSLKEGAIRIFDRQFHGMILPFDEHAAQPYADIVVRRRRSGSPIDKFDAQIAAIAASRRMAIATRDVGDFEDCGIDVVNPWTA
jgi:predicted nucleic acid-binding protein